MKLSSAALLLLLHAGWCHAAANPLREAARRLTQQHQYAQAIDAYRQLLIENPADTELLVEAAQVHGFADRNAEAAGIYERALRRAPSRRTEWLLPLAWQTLWSGNAQQAAALFAEAGAHAIGSGEAYRGHAQACAELGMNACALEQWKLLLALHPGDLPAALGLARTHLWMDRYQEAEAQFLEILRRDPGHQGARLGLAQARNFSGRHRAAVLEFDRLADQGEPALRVQAARAYYWAGFPDAAVQLLADAQDGDAAWLRNFRAGRAVRSYVWAGFDRAGDADRQHSQALSVGGGWRRNGAETFEYAIRRPRLTGHDQGLQSMYADLVRSDGDGILQVMDAQASQLQTAFSAGPAAQGMALASRLTGALADKFARVASNQNLNRVDGLGPFQAQLNSPAFAQLKRLAEAGDQAGVSNFLGSAEGRTLLSALRQSTAVALQGHRSDHATVTGSEILGNYTWRLGGARNPAGTVWASVGLGLREYNGWRTSAWKARARYIPADRWIVDADAGNGTIETPGAMRNQVRYDSASIALRHALTPRLNLELAAGSLRFDDANQRRKLAWSMDYLAWSKPRLRLGWEGNAFSNSRPWSETFSDRGYYNPKQYRENRLFASVDGDAGRYSYSAKLGTGRYRESGVSASSGGRSTVMEGAIAYDVDSRLQLRASAGRSNSAAGGSGGQGYWRRHAGISLTGWF